MKDKTPLKIIAVIVIPIVLALILRLMEVGKRDKEISKKNDYTSVGNGFRRGDDDVTILTRWEMPDELVEISGIDWLDSLRMACVQDEKGIVFIYDMAESKVDRVIPFGPDGDYEGVAVTPDAIYVLRADGTVFEISNYAESKPLVRNFRTPLSKKEDSESLTYDAKNNRLLIAVKGEDSRGGDNYKGVYVFDMEKKTLNVDQPFVKIPLNDPLLKSAKKPKNAISPSDIAIHPLTGELYVLEGTKPKLVIMSTDGVLKQVFELKKSDFPQPEGLTFGRDGRIYISNEGGDGSGNILDIKLAMNSEER